MNNFLQKIFHHQQKSNKSRIPFRLNFIFIIAGILFIILIGKLAYLQVIQGAQFKAEVNRSDNTIKTDNVQRGMIYDTNGELLVGNQNHRAITYTKGMNASSSSMYDIANKLSTYITVPTDTLTSRQKADYYLSNRDNLNNIQSKIKDNSSQDNQYNDAVNYVQNDKSIHFTSFMENAAIIFAKMSSAYQLSTTYIKNTNVSSKELSQVGEHLSEMPGIEIGNSWTREYPQGKSLQSMIGTVSSDRTGLPSDQINTLLSQGYSRNDSVGQSYLEKKYEPALRGSKSQTQVQVTGNSRITNEVQKYAGQKGDNLQLTINNKFQNKMQQLVEASQKGGVGKSTGAYAVAMDPNTGGIIGMAGVNRDPETGKLTPNELGSINSAIVMGSVVKGATVSGGLMSNTISANNNDNIMTDKPIIAGGNKRTSWFNQNGSANTSVNASQALEISSNSYMMQLAMKEANFHYREGGPLNLNLNIFNKLRGYFNQFGLGVKTGIDIPGETTGLKGGSSQANIGQALDLSYGNYDAYTTMQVAQYMSTIANGGYRLQPHILQSIRGSNKDGSLGPIKYSVTPKVLNEINMTTQQKDVVKKGLYDVVHGTNRYRTGMMLNQLKPEVSGKTGTAQTFYKGKETITLSLASYAPSKNPKVVLALAIPNLPVDAESNNVNLANEIYNAYWKYVQSPSNVNK